MQANAVHEEWIKKFIICNMRAFYCPIVGMNLNLVWFYDGSIEILEGTICNILQIVFIGLA